MNFLKKIKSLNFVIALISIALATMLIVAIVLGALSCGRNSGEKHSIDIAGSTSVMPYIEILAEEFMHLNKGIVINVQGGGSGVGIQAAETGVAEIGMSSRMLKDNEKKGLDYKIIARDGLAIIVHPQNPVIRKTGKELDLSIEDIREIYMGKKTNWSELSGNDAKIHVVTREEGSGTRTAFEELVMQEGETKHRISAKAIVQSANGSVRMTVSDNPNSIGFISLGNIKALRGQKQVIPVKINGFAPTADNIIEEHYSLARPFLLVYKKDGILPKNAQSFMDFVFSPAGIEIMRNKGLIVDVQGEV